MDADVIGLREQLAEIQRHNELTEMENKIFQLYAARILSEAADEQDDASKVRPSGKKGKKDRIPVEITMQQKQEIVSAEMDHAKELLDKMKGVSDKLIDDLRALLEEAEIKIAEVSKDQFEFKRDINSNASGKPISEKVLHFLEDKLRIRDSMVDKLNLKNATLKQQILKLENQLQHKEEMGEVLHSIDFDQLKIENQQYLAKIQERNDELLKLKLTTGNIVQTLNACKKKLDKLILESETLKKMIGEKQALSKTVQEEIETIDGEKGKVKKANGALQKQIEESGMPEVLEYVNQKATAHQLKKELANFERKVEIAEMTRRRGAAATRAASSGDKGWR